jgi:hypothetical protein
VSNKSSVARGCGYFVTPEGHADLISADTCECRPVIDGGLYVCHECGTVWGKLRPDYSPAVPMAKEGRRG